LTVPKKLQKQLALKESAVPLPAMQSQRKMVLHFRVQVP
jgi:hypothetical protein